ncbi:DMT family transporter [Shimia biformata]|uniref:DMT family transporter n=1 Tax=Shimia biformata TaxID=1294299 RepID=UPI00194E055A|nr:DMT family transporter [Shimia biformata]
MSIIQKSMSPRAWGELFLLSLIWGAVFLAVRLALDEVGVWTSIAHRVFWAALLLWAVVWWRAEPVPRGIAVWAAFAGMGVLNNLIPFFFLNWAQLHIESGLTAILNAGTAVFGVLVAALFLADERLTLRKMAGVLIGFLGVATAIGLDALRQFDPRSTAQLAAVAATISYAFAGVWARKFMSGLTPLVSAAGMLTMSALVAVPVAWVVDGPFTFALSPLTLVALFYYAVIATAGAYLLYYRVLAAAGSGNLLIGTLIIPPIAITLGALVLHESLPPRAFAGFGLIALGLLVLDGRLIRKIPAFATKAPESDGRI